MSYYVVLGDVVRSRSIEDREAFGRRFRTICETINERYRDDVYAEFKLLKGIDETGGVLSSPGRLYGIVRDLHEALRPNSLRVVVAGGEIDVGRDDRDVATMDGEAFHRAAERLESLAEGDLVFDLIAHDERLDRAIADEINLLLHRRREWTDRQREIVGEYEASGNQYAVANRLGISQQAVSNALDRADWSLIRTIEDRLERTLDEYEPSSRRAVAGTGS